MEELMKKYLKAVKEGKGFDFIAKYGHEFTKPQLIAIIKEFEYAIYDMKTYSTKEDLYNTVVETLTEDL